MTCPHCGAYSPKNTSVCNRCGRRLPMLEAQPRPEQQEHASAYVLPEHEGYGYGYRQPPQTKFQIFLERVGTFLDDIAEDPFAKRVALAIIIVPIVIYIIFRFCGVCGGCFQCGSACSPNEPFVSSSDISFTDVSSADVVSGSSVSSSDTAS